MTQGLTVTCEQKQQYKINQMDGKASCFAEQGHLTKKNPAQTAKQSVQSRSRDGQHWGAQSGQETCLKRATLLTCQAVGCTTTGSR